MKDKRQAVRWVCLAGLLCAYLWIAWRVPYTHDDWDWGLPVGLERWLTGELNNRYAGTFFVLVMTRSQWVKTLVIGVSMFLIPQLAVCLTNGEPGRRFSMELLAHALMLSVPIVTWRQTYGWVSAFANYVVAAVWMLLIMLLLRQAFLGRSRWWIAVLLFPLSLTGQLFVENLAMILTVFTVAVTGCAMKIRRGRAAALCALAGALAGLVLMFYNPLYGDLIDTGTAVDGVRKLIFPVDAGLREIVSTVFKYGFGSILPGLFEAHPVLWAVIVLLCLFRGARRRRHWLLLVPAGLFSAVYLASCWWNSSQQRLETPWVCQRPWLRAIGAVIMLALAVLALWDDRENRWPGLSLLAAALALIVPFALITEYGPRCCYTSLILLLLLALRLVKDIPLVLWHKIGIGLICLGLLLFHLRAYWVIGQCSNLRARLLREAVEQNAQSATLPTESTDVFYMWGRNPGSDQRAGYFRQFYDVPEDLQLIILPQGSYDQWPDVSQEMLDRAMVYN